MLNTVETDNMATSSENSDLEEKKKSSENLTESIEILDQEPLEEIFEETKSPNFHKIPGEFQLRYRRNAICLVHLPELEDILKSEGSEELHDHESFSSG